MLRMLTALLTVLVVTARGAAIGQPAESAGNYVLHEKRFSASAIASHWRRGDRIDSDAIVPVRIGLKQNNIEVGNQRLFEISHPASPEYGKHLTPEEVTELFAPSRHTVQAVRDWLVEAGVDPRVIGHSDNKGWLAADIPAKDAERLFRTELHEYENSRNGDLRVGCDSYHLPDHLTEHIDYVTPGVKFSGPLKKRNVKRSESWGPRPKPHWQPMPHGPWSPPPHAASLPEDLRACGVNITPPCWRALYGIPLATLDQPENAPGVYEQGSYYAVADIEDYFATYQPRVPQGTKPILKSIDGGYAPVPVNSSGNNGEADIDFDISISLLYPQSVILYQVDDSYYAPREIALVNTFNTFLDALDGSYCTYSAYGITGDSPGIDPIYPDNHTGGYKGQLMCGTYKPTKVITASYGESESNFPKNYVLRQCNEFMKLALQGHTIMVSSSDFGVGGFPNDPDPNGCMSGCGQNSTIYNPDYPSGCPWLLSVGATALYSNQTVLDPESAMQVSLYAPGRSTAYKYFASSGGFSNDFPTAWYQKAAVAEYFANHDPDHPYYYVNANKTNIGMDGGIYNRGGRGYPDVSANGAYMNAFVGGVENHWFGTSLASPIWASVITLINQQRTLHGKGPVGFINPTLYENPWVLNDIKNGSNPNCYSSGFTAVEGWDPITGLGTPNYPKMLELFLSLP